MSDFIEICDMSPKMITETYTYQTPKLSIVLLYEHYENEYGERSTSSSSTTAGERNENFCLTITAEDDIYRYVALINLAWIADLRTPVLCAVFDANHHFIFRSIHSQLQKFAEEKVDIPILDGKMAVPCEVEVMDVKYKFTVALISEKLEEVESLKRKLTKLEKQMCVTYVKTADIENTNAQLSHQNAIFEAELKSLVEKVDALSSELKILKPAA